MINIKEINEQRIVIHSPNYVHKFQTVLFLVLGALPTVGILLDPESSNFGIIVPLLIFITGLLWLRFGGKGDSLIADKLTGQVEVTMEQGVFKKPDTRIIPFDEIDHTELDINRASSRRSYGIVLFLKDGSSLQGTPYVNRKKKAELAHSAFAGFFGR